jgi:hypothetical protein
MSKLGMLAALAISIPFVGAIACEDHATEEASIKRQPSDCVDSDMVYSDGAEKTDNSVDGQPRRQVCVSGKWKSAS